MEIYHFGAVDPIKEHRGGFYAQICYNESIELEVTKDVTEDMSIIPFEIATSEPTRVFEVHGTIHKNGNALKEADVPKDEIIRKQMGRSLTEAIRKDPDLSKILIRCAPEFLNTNPGYGDKLYVYALFQMDSPRKQKTNILEKLEDAIIMFACEVSEHAAAGTAYKFLHVTENIKPCLQPVDDSLLQKIKETGITAPLTSAKEFIEMAFITPEYSMRNIFLYEPTHVEEKGWDHDWTWMKKGQHFYVGQDFYKYSPRGVYFGGIIGNKEKSLIPAMKGYKAGRDKLQELLEKQCVERITKDRVFKRLIQEASPAEYSEWEGKLKFGVRIKFKEPDQLAWSSYELLIRLRGILIQLAMEQSTAPVTE